MASTWKYNLDQLWDGVLAASIAHAVGSAKLPDLSSMQSWEDDNYNFQDYSGSHGTICFGMSVDRKPRACVGGVVGRKSERFGANSSDPAHVTTLLAEVPQTLASLADVLPDYFLVNAGDATRPVLTAVMWSKGEGLVSNDTWDDFIKHGGGHFRLLLEPEDLIAVWCEQYGLDVDEVALVESLYARRRATFAEVITLASQERRLIERHGAEGYLESQLLLQQIGIL
jgi:hypothetical protein